jgi:hypothetical protein
MGGATRSESTLNVMSILSDGYTVAVVMLRTVRELFVIKFCVSALLLDMLTATSLS